MSPFFERVFWQRSVLRVGSSYENYTTDYALGSLLGAELTLAQIPERGRPAPAGRERAV